jgi:hypothetical protein
MLAPAFFKYGGTVADHHRVVGPLIVSIGLVAVWEICREMRWWNFVLGVWLCLSLLIWDHTTEAVVATLVVGVGALVTSLFKGKKKSPTGGTWADLFRDDIPESQLKDLREG